jgi:hypothetical protein
VATHVWPIASRARAIDTLLTSATMVLAADGRVAQRAECGMRGRMSDETTPRADGRPIRWGILGPGRIAAQFATGLGALPDAELLAVASRSRAGAEAFGARFGVPRRYAGYAALMADPDVDVVYVATPHSFHHAHTLSRLLRPSARLAASWRGPGGPPQAIESGAAA